MGKLSIIGLSKTFAGQARPALSKLSMEVPQGKLTALLGPSGCGKSTLLKLVAGLLKPTGGNIKLDDKSILDLPPERRNTVMVFQDHLLFPHLDVAGNVGFGLRMRKLDPAVIEAKVDEALSMVRLEGLHARMPGELSGGQQQRVALARALVVQPDLLLLDEPLSNLDAHLRVEMRNLITDVQRELRLTCVCVTHDQEEAVALADQVALILDGELQQVGPPRDFYDKPANERVARFFGAQNILPGMHDGKIFSSDWLDLPKPCDITGECKAVLRPEKLALSGDSEKGASDGVDVGGTVREVSYLGTHCKVVIALPARESGKDGHDLTVIAPPDTKLAAGDKALVRVPANAVSFV